MFCHLCSFTWVSLSAALHPKCTNTMFTISLLFFLALYKRASPHLQMAGNDSGKGGQEERCIIRSRIPKTKEAFVCYRFQVRGIKMGCGGSAVFFSLSFCYFVFMQWFLYHFDFPLFFLSPVILIMNFFFWCTLFYFCFVLYYIYLREGVSKFCLIYTNVILQGYIYYYSILQNW